MNFAQEAEIKKLYQIIEKTGLFKNFPECKGCAIACIVKKNVTWLSNVEAKKSRNLLKISKEGKSYFFEAQPCPLLSKEKRCTIYKERPFECRVNPLTIYEIDGDLWWVLYTECPIVGKAKDLSKVISMAKEFIKQIEPYVTQNIRNELRQKSSDIRKFDPLIVGKDVIKVKKIGSLKSEK
jgi:Fe-S-cluster containining protein